MKTRSGFLYVFTGGEMKCFGRVRIDNNRYAYTAGNPEGIPIEDFGDYVVLKNKVTPEKAYKQFEKYL